MDGKWTETAPSRLPGPNLPRLGLFLDGEKLPAKIANYKGGFGLAAAASASASLTSWPARCPTGPQRWLERPEPRQVPGPAFQTAPAGNDFFC